MKKIRLSLIAATMSLIAFTACDKETQNATKDKVGMTVKMTDAPGDYAALNVQIERVDIYSESSGWVTISNESQIVNVLELTNGVETTLATSTELEAGLYTSVAVYFGSDNSIQVQSDGEFASLDVGGEGMIVVDINEEVSANSSSEVLLDFNVAESVVLENGTFTLSPSVHHVADLETGIHGEIEGDAFANVTLSNSSGSFSAYTNASGEFLIRGMSGGSYTLTIEAQGESSGESGGSLEGSLGLGLEIPGLIEGSAEGEANGTITVNYDNVVIVDGEITQMGTISLQ